MLVEKALSILFFFILAVTVVFLLSGCGQPVTDGKLEPETAQSIKPSLPLLDTQLHGPLETAYFALGWFWGSDSQFGSIEGVIHTRVGYCGGTTASPSYYNIGDHSETVQVDFDPTIISYGQLLLAFWNAHDAAYPSYSIQYRSAIFYTTEQQQKLANETLQKEEVKIGKRLFTDIEPFSGFYIAEDYHQKYNLRQITEVANELYAIYPDPAEFRDSTAAAKLNGYLGGNGDADILNESIDSLGLSEAGRRALLERAQYGLFPVCPVVSPWDCYSANSNYNSSSSV